MIHLPAAAHDLELIGYVGEPGTGLPGWALHKPAWPTASPTSRVLWEQLAQPWAVRRDRVDLLHALVNVGPMIRTCPLVVTIHDLAFERYPELFPGGRRRYLQRMTHHTARHAARVIVDSMNTGDDVHELMGVPNERITVVYPGLNITPVPRDELDTLAALRRRFSLPEEYVLFVGTLEPRKNIVTLLEAWSILAGRYGIKPTLVIAGGKGWFYETLEARTRTLGLTDSVRYLGYVPDGELPALYATATLFVFPSLYEGFGFPPLEAMACGTPVLVSDRPSLPEVVGEAGLILPAQDPTAWAEAVAELLCSPERRTAMSEAGRAQASRFSWERTAEQTVDAYRWVLSHA